MKKHEIHARSLERRLQKQAEAAQRKEKRLLKRAERQLERIKSPIERKEARLKKRLAIAKIKQPSIKDLKRKLWQITSLIVRRGTKTCYTCGRTGPISAGHFWPKGSHPSVAFHLDNLRPQGNCCNLYKSGNLAEYSIRLRAEIGEARFETLNLLAHMEKKWDRNELLQLIDERQKLLEAEDS